MIPRGPLLLGLAGLIPFAACALGQVMPLPLIAGREDAILAHYGLVILCFMSGVLWGFATRGGSVLPYALSVIPALWGFFATLLAPPLPALALGFAGLLALDWHFARAGLAPGWWMPLRLILTAGVLAALAIGLWL